MLDRRLIGRAVVPTPGLLHRGEFGNGDAFRMPGDYQNSRSRIHSEVTLRTTNSHFHIIRTGAENLRSFDLGEFPFFDNRGDFENQVIAPLNVFGGARKGQTSLAKPIGVDHLRHSS